MHYVFFQMQMSSELNSGTKQMWDEETGGRNRKESLSFNSVMVQISASVEFACPPSVPGFPRGSLASSHSPQTWEFSFRRLYLKPKHQTVTAAVQRWHWLPGSNQSFKTSNSRGKSLAARPLTHTRRQNKQQLSQGFIDIQAQQAEQSPLSLSSGLHSERSSTDFIQSELVLPQPSLQSLPSSIHSQITVLPLISWC